MTPDTTSLKARVDRIVLDADPAQCYDPELARQIALSIDSGEKSEALLIYRRFQDKFKKEFSATLLKTLVTEHINALRRTVAPAPLTGWESQLVRGPGKDGEPGKILPLEENAALYFRAHLHQRIGYNEFTAQHAVIAHIVEPFGLAKGEALGDHHDTLFAMWLQRETGAMWKPDVIRRAMDVVAREKTYHPVRDYLDAQRWDGVKRLDTWLFRFAGAGPDEGDEGPTEPVARAKFTALQEFISAAGRCWMVSAVARVRVPGSHVHHMLVFEGGEGLGKSMLVQKIGKGWAQAMTGALDGKGAQELVASAVWIWEFAELASLKKSQEVESVKAFISRPDDTFRPAYGHRVITYKRQCAFVATVNNDEYLDSSAWEDGKRRIWPIRCTRPFDLDGLDADTGSGSVIDQLWAEADMLFASGARWHFDRDLDAGLIETAKREQLARVPDNPNAGGYLRAADSVAGLAIGRLAESCSVEDVLDNMKVLVGRDRGAMARECGKVLKAAGWRIFQASDGKRRYRRPGTFEY